MTEGERSYPWLPFAVIIAAFGASLILLGWLLSPMASALLTGASFALLSYPVVAAPLARLAKRLPLPPMMGHSLVAGLSTLVVALAIGGPLLLVAWAVLSEVGLTLEDGWKVWSHDPATIARVARVIADKSQDIHQLYPWIPLDAEGI